MIQRSQHRQGPGIVAFHEVSTSSRALSGCLAWWRRPAAMLCHPLMRRMLIARLRQVAITRGACPAVRTCDLSSSKVTSRTQWRRFSMPQWWLNRQRKHPGQRVAHPAPAARVGHPLQHRQQSFVVRRVRLGRQCRGRWHADVTSGSGGWLGNPIQTRWSHPPQPPRRSHHDNSRGHRPAHQPFRDPDNAGISEAWLINRRGSLPLPVMTKTRRNTLGPWLPLRPCAASEPGFAQTHPRAERALSRG